MLDLKMFIYLRDIRNKIILLFVLKKSIFTDSDVCFNS